DSREGISRLPLKSRNTLAAVMLHHLKVNITDAACIAHAVFDLLAFAAQHGTGNDHASILSSYVQRSGMRNCVAYSCAHAFDEHLIRHALLAELCPPLIDSSLYMVR